MKKDFVDLLSFWRLRPRFLSTRKIKTLTTDTAFARYLDFIGVLKVGGRLRDVPEFNLCRKSPVLCLFRYVLRVGCSPQGNFRHWHGETFCLPASKCGCGVLAILAQARLPDSL